MPALNSKYTVGGKVYRAPNLHQFNSSRKRNRTKRRKMA
jgi:hypothetical protein